MEKLILTTLPAFIAAVVTYFTVIKNIFSPLKIKVANKQLYNVYLPLFSFIEPYLYKDIPIDILLEFLCLFRDIKNKHYELIDCSLINDIEILEKSIKNNKYCSESYDHVCRNLDNLFEKTRKYLKLPTRTFSYKINHKQLNNTYKFIFDLIFDLIEKLLPILLIGLFFFTVYSLFDLILIFFRLKK